jgi:hypothetical protein
MTATLKTAQDYGFAKDAKLATTASFAMELFAKGWRQVSDYSTDRTTVAAIPIAEWRPETRERLAKANGRCWVVFAPPA